MNAKSTWNDGWDAGYSDTIKAQKAAAADARGQNFEPAEQQSPDADPGFDREAWEDGYTIGAHYALEGTPTLQRAANPYA